MKLKMVRKHTQTTNFLQNFGLGSNPQLNFNIYGSKMMFIPSRARFLDSLNSKHLNLLGIWLARLGWRNPPILLLLLKMIESFLEPNVQPF